MNISPISITPLALEEIRKIMANKGIPAGYSLRVGVRGGGCGASFMLGFDTEKAFDQTYTYEDILVLIDKRQLMYVLGILIDYEQTAEGIGFTFAKQ